MADSVCQVRTVPTGEVEHLFRNPLDREGDLAGFADRLERRAVFVIVLPTVGAGDAFFAVSAPMTYCGMPLSTVAFLGNVAGAISVSEIKRDDGARQWAYRGKALYTFVKDVDPGSVGGNSPARLGARRKNGAGEYVGGGVRGAAAIDTRGSGIGLAVVLPGDLVIAERDTTIPAGDAERLRRLLPDAKVIRLPGVGHLAHEEQPERIAALLIEEMDRRT